VRSACPVTTEQFNLGRLVFKLKFWRYVGAK
jgi:hypothetical protein